MELNNPAPCTDQRKYKKILAFLELCLRQHYQSNTLIVFVKTNIFVKTLIKTNQIYINTGS
jgi:hypothetical protein